MVSKAIKYFNSSVLYLKMKLLFCLFPEQKQSPFYRKQPNYKQRSTGSTYPLYCHKQNRRGRNRKAVCY